MKGKGLEFASELIDEVVQAEVDVSKFAVDLTQGFVQGSSVLLGVLFWIHTQRGGRRP